MREPTLYVATGLNCSGKTHLILQAFREERIFSIDTRRINHPPHVSRTWIDVWKKFGKAQLEWAGTDIGARFAWDGCFHAPWHRSQIIGTTLAHGWKVVALYFDTPLDLCLARNAERPQAERVLPGKIERMYDELVPPRLHEGYDEIIVVTPGMERDVIEHLRKRSPTTYAMM